MRGRGGPLAGSFTVILSWALHCAKPQLLSMTTLILSFQLLTGLHLHQQPFLASHSAKSAAAHQGPTSLLKLLKHSRRPPM